MDIFTLSLNYDYIIFQFLLKLIPEIFHNKDTAENWFLNADILTQYYPTAQQRSRRLELWCPDQQS